MEIGNPTKNEVNLTYPSGENSNPAVDHHIHYSSPVTHVESGFQYELEMSVWDNGIGFRYVFPNQTEMEIEEELTSFTLPMDVTAWYQMNTRDLQDLYSSKLVSSITDTEILEEASLPTFELADDQGYVLLTEANLFDYAGIAYKSMGKGTFKGSFLGYYKWVYDESKSNSLEASDYFRQLKMIWSIMDACYECFRSCKRRN